MSGDHQPKRSSLRTVTRTPWPFVAEVEAKAGTWGTINLTRTYTKAEGVSAKGKR